MIICVFRGLKGASSVSQTVPSYASCDKRCSRPPWCPETGPEWNVSAVHVDLVPPPTSRFHYIGSLLNPLKWASRRILYVNDCPWMATPQFPLFLPRTPLSPLPHYPIPSLEPPPARYCAMAYNPARRFCDLALPAMLISLINGSQILLAAIQRI